MLLNIFHQPPSSCRHPTFLCVTIFRLHAYLPTVRELATLSRKGWSSCPHLWTNSRSMEIIVGWMTRPGHMSPPRPRSCMLWVLSHDWLFATPWTAACQAPLSMEFSRQEHWSGLPFPTPGDLTYPAIKPESLVSHALAGEFLTTALPEEPRPRS